MNILEIDNLSVQFGVTHAVRDVSLTVATDSITGILGANGAGKTTTLLGILGRVRRSSGRIRFAGQDVTSLSTRELVRSGLALCPENRRLFPNMTIEDNLLLGAHGTRRGLAHERLDNIYDRYGWVRDRRSELAGRLSGGQQQIVAIARAMMSAPTLLMLDEPSSGLSPVAVNEIGAFLEEVVVDGTAVLLVEQNVKLVHQLCREAWVLSRGQVVENGDTAELLTGARVADAYLGGNTDEASADG